MHTESAIREIIAHKPELIARGIESLSLFGSRARGDAGPDSDFDLAVRLDSNKPIGLFAFAEMQLELSRIVGGPVDLVAEPARKPRMQNEIDRWRRRVF